MDSDERKRVIAMVRELVREHCPELLPILLIKFSRRFTRRMGDARLRPGTEARVRFSVPLWERASREQRDATVAHEVAHLVCDHRHRGSRPHGAEWQAIMRSMGYAPERCHTVDRSGLVRLYEIECVCRTHKVSRRWYNRAKKGEVACKHCHRLAQPRRIP